MSVLKTVITASLLISLAGLSFAGVAQAQDDIETIETIEKVPSKKLQQRGERIRGPITSLHTAGLMLVGFDKNSDYSITRAEFDAGCQHAFEKADTDKSDALSLFELEDWREKALGSLDAAPGNLAFDKDYNQRVTREEFTAALEFTFKGADKDKDGVIVFTELVHVFEMPTRPVFEDKSEGVDSLGQQDRTRRRRAGF